MTDITESTIEGILSSEECLRSSGVSVIRAFVRDRHGTSTVEKRLEAARRAVSVNLSYTDLKKLAGAVRCCRFCGWRYGSAY